MLISNFLESLFLHLTYAIRYDVFKRMNASNAAIALLEQNAVNEMKKESRHDPYSLSQHDPPVSAFVMAPIEKKRMKSNDSTSTNDNSNHHKKGMNFTNPLVGGGQMKSSTILKSAGSKITEKMK